MAGISGGVSPALGGLLSTWIVGPLWGINTIIGLSAIVELRRPYITRRRSRILLSMVLLLLASSSGHALVSFADLLNGFLHTDDPSAYFENLPRSLFIARTSFYLVNALTVEFFMTWRVHVTWGGNNLIILPFIVLNLAGLGLGIVSITRLKVSESRTSLVTSALRVTTATFAMFLAIQVGGTFLIAWRKLATPIVVSEKMTKKWSPRYLFWLFVESGCLYIIATTLSLAWSFGSPAIGNIFTTMLGQVAVFVPLTITLRECWKTKQAYRARPSVTSRLRAETFLVEDRPTVHNRLGPMAVEIEELHDSGNLFGVRIDTTTQEYPDGLKDVKITDGR